MSELSKLTKLVEAHSALLDEIDRMPSIGASTPNSASSTVAAAESADTNAIKTNENPPSAAAVTMTIGGIAEQAVTAQDTVRDEREEVGVTTTESSMPIQESIVPAAGDPNYTKTNVKTTIAAISFENANKRAEKMMAAKKSIEDSQLEPRLGKLLHKLDATDPVTGEKRFGEQTRNKISELHTNVKAVLSRYNELGAVVFAEWETAKEIQRMMNLEEENRVNGQMAAGMESDLMTGETHREQELRREREKQERKEKEREEDEERQRLAQQARVAREKKQAHREAQLSLLDQVRGALSEFVRVINSSRTAYHTIDPSAPSLSNSALETAILEILDRNEPTKAKDALKTVVGIVERIIAHPDDSQARYLRVTHPVLQAKLTSLAGGFALLRKLGFEAQIVSKQGADAGKDSDSTLPTLSIPLPLPAAPTVQSSSSSSGSSSSDSAGFTLAEAVAKSPFSYLSPHTPFDLVFTMTEPPIDLLGGASAPTSAEINASRTTTITAKATTTTTIVSGESGGCMQTAEKEGEGFQAVKLSWVTWFDGLTSFRDVLTSFL